MNTYCLRDEIELALSSKAGLLLEALDRLYFGRYYGSFKEHVIF